MDTDPPYYSIEKDFGAVKKVYDFPLYPSEDGKRFIRKTNDHVLKSTILVPKRGERKTTELIIDPKLKGK